MLVVRLGNGDVDGGDDNHHNLLFQDTRRDDQRCLVLHCHRFATPADNIYTQAIFILKPGVLDNGIEHYFSMSTFSCF